MSVGGSGIPQVKGTAMLDLKMPWAKVLAARLSGGILCGLFGLSLGREGPASVTSRCARGRDTPPANLRARYPSCVANSDRTTARADANSHRLKWRTS